MREKLPVKIKIGEKEYDLNYEEELLASEETINENLVDQPPLFAWYAVLEELARDELSAKRMDLAKAKLDLDSEEASLDLEFRKNPPKVEGKITEAVISNSVKTHEKYLAARIAVDVAENIINKARGDVGILSAIKESFAHRKSTLIALAANMRAQADPEIFVKKEQAKQKL